MMNLSMYTEMEPGFLRDFVRFIGHLSGRRPELLQALREHATLVAIPVSLAIVVAVPLGILVTRFRLLETPVLGFANVMQTVPSLALLAFMLVIGLGLGFKSAATGLFLYALLPILRNTVTGIDGVDQALKRAAIGMGMTDMQILMRIELPLAMRVIMAGIRTSAVIAIGVAVLGAYIGAGGLGQFITRGLGLVRNDLILLGAVPSALMALMTDFVLGRVQEWVTPRGLKI